MNISDHGKSLIKSFEGCSLTAYKCPSGVLTIGYGRTYGVKEGMVITKAQADSFFNEDIKKYEAYVQKYNISNQNQYDALVSFTYNCGPGALYYVMSSKDITGTMALYVNGGGIRLDGLVRRRKAEIDLYNTPIANSEYETKRWQEKGVATFTKRVGVYNNFLDTIAIDHYEVGEFSNYDSVIETNQFRYISYVSKSGIRRYVPIYQYSTNQYRATFK